MRIHKHGLFWGLILIGVGVIMLLDKMHIHTFDQLVETYWPMLIIALGASRLAESRRPWSGIWLVITGLWLQAVTLHLWGITYQSSWPLLLIALGAGMVLRTLFGGFREARHG